jgi:hypothetical protein
LEAAGRKGTFWNNLERYHMVLEMNTNRPQKKKTKQKEKKQNQTNDNNNNKINKNITDPFFLYN